VTVQLVPLAEQHLPELAPMLDDPDIARFTRFPTPIPDDFLPRLLARYSEGRDEGSRELFAALEADQVVGLALAPHIDAEARELELGYLIDPARRGRGLATELLRQLTDWAFAVHRPIRIGLVIDAQNIASQKVAERAGYQLEGTLRSTYVKPGIRADVQIWSRLDSDPAPQA
jgi:RimJ/RimL family protein N-acetyltransferase